ncbi:Urea ABC transporter, permease protein UrtB [hydrothermal vent metagenome]|uniref:Urea ABC transporter, permease protein UrtB n=1 Tax=hydrothermal vent metagenome TaxID=652676 RepID=A0A3B1AGP9_9ZZZZ
MSPFSITAIVKKPISLWLFLCMISVPAPQVLAEEIPGNNLLDDAWKTLSSKNYNNKAKALETIARQNPPQALAVMKAMLEGQLYYSKHDKALYFLQETGDNYTFSPVFSGEQISQENRRGFKKVKVNNRLRSTIRQLLAVMQLKHKDADIRLAAVQELLKNPELSASHLIKKAVGNETDSRVITAMQTLLAVIQIENGDETEQRSAIKTLSQSLNSSAMNALRDYQAPTEALKNAAQSAIKKIDDKRDLYAKAETVFFGLSLGSVLALSAIGLAITFGVMGVINMAHGELMMIGAYTTYVVQLLMPNNIGASILVAIPAAFIVAGLVGIAIERSVIRHLYGRPLETLLATFGVSLVLQQTVRTIFSPLNRSVETPEWMSGAWQINEVLALTWNRLYIILFCLAVFAALIMVMKKTTLGLQVRAVSQNRNMARAMGVRSTWVDALTFGLGSGIAGLAGVALSLLTNVGPNLGQAYIIDSFMVVVFGGVGNLWGTLVAGMSLGVINKLLEPWAGAVLAKILVLIFIILFIQKRPKGLFPQRGRAAED